MGYFGQDVDEPVFSPLRSIEIADDALFWSPSPHGGPNAVYDAQARRTWIAFLKAGGDLYATYYDHDTGEIATPALVAAFPFTGADFHHVPAVMLADDGKLHIIYGGHNTDAHRHYRMNTARTLTGWTAQTLTTGTYPFACTTDDGELIFTDRPSSAHADTFPAHEFGAIHRCTNGSTWVRTEAIDTSGAPEADSDFYQCDLLWADGKVHIVWTVARGASHDGTREDIYYAAFDPDAGTWSAADGTALGAIITWAEHSDCLVLTRSHDGGISPRASLVWHRGAPVIALFIQEEVASSTTAELIVAEWTGAAWETSDPLFTRSGTVVPVAVSTPDELLVMAQFAHQRGDARGVAEFRRVDGEWRISNAVARSTPGHPYDSLTPVRQGGPAFALGMKYDASGGFPGNDDTVVGILTLITDDAAEPEHDHAADPFSFLTLTEQGANIATPTSGLWRAFFKSDGLHVIDDAGTVAGPLGTGGGGGVSGDLVHKFVQPTSGTTSINTSAAWANLSSHVASFSDLTLTGCTAGDVVMVTMSGAWASVEAQAARLDVATIVSAAIVNYISTGTSTPAAGGVRSWHGPASTWISFGGAFRYTIQSGDLNAGSLTLRPRVKTDGARTLHHDPGQFAVVNIGAQA